MHSYCSVSVCLDQVLGHRYIYCCYYSLIIKKLEVPEKVTRNTYTLRVIATRRVPVRERAPAQERIPPPHLTTEPRLD